MTKHPNSKVGRVVSVSNHALHYNQECLREISKMLSNSALLRWEVHCNCAVYLEACRHEIEIFSQSRSRARELDSGSIRAVGILQVFLFAVAKSVQINIPEHI